MARTKFRKVATKMWMDRKFSAFSNSSPSAKYLWQFLISGPFTTNIPGVVITGRAGMAESLGWPLRGIGDTASQILAEGLGEVLPIVLGKGFQEALPEGFEEALGKAIAKGCFSLSNKESLLGVFRGFDGVLREIEEQGMAITDFDNQLIWMPNSLYYNKPESPNVVKSWAYDWERVPECDLQVAIYNGMARFFEDIGGSWEEAFEETITAPTKESKYIFSKAYGKAIGKPFAKAYAKAMGKGLVIALATDTVSVLEETTEDKREDPKYKKKSDPVETSDDDSAASSPTESADALVNEPEEATTPPPANIDESPPSEFEGDVDTEVEGDDPPELDEPLELPAPEELDEGEPNDNGQVDQDDNPLMAATIEVPAGIIKKLSKTFLESTLRDWAVGVAQDYLQARWDHDSSGVMFPEPESGKVWDRILWTSAEVVEQCVRLDKFTTIDVENVLGYAAADETFWLTVKLFPSGLREATGKDKTSRFRTILLQHQQAQVKANQNVGFEE